MSDSVKQRIAEIRERAENNKTIYVNCDERIRYSLEVGWVHVADDTTGCDLDGSYAYPWKTDDVLWLCDQLEKSLRAEDAAYVVIDKERKRREDAERALIAVLVAVGHPVEISGKTSREVVLEDKWGWMRWKEDPCGRAVFFKAIPVVPTSNEEKDDLMPRSGHASVLTDEISHTTKKKAEEFQGTVYSALEKRAERS